MINQPVTSLTEFLMSPVGKERSVYFVKGFEAARQFIERNAPETVTCFDCSVSEYADYTKGWNLAIKVFSH